MKRILILALLFIQIISFIFLFGSQKAEAATAVPILMYHYIRDYSNPKDTTGEGLSVSPAVFDQEMGWLASKGYTPISLDTMYAIFAHKAQASAKPIVITFDDGYIDLYVNAYPILKKYGFHAVSFVITGFVGQPAFLSWNNISEMQSSGVFTFESHTVNHAYLPGVSYSAALKELQNSKSMLQSHTGYTVNFIAYPFGASNGAVWNAARKSGYLGGIGTWYGKAYYSSMNMPRVRISGNISLAAFVARLK